MQEINLKYLSEKYLTLEQLASGAETSVEEIKHFIKAKMIPEPSYKVRQTIKISSPLNDEYQVEETVWYFPESHIELLKNCRKGNQADLKKSFIESMRQHLLSHPDKNFAYGNVFETDGSPNEEKLVRELENEWNYFCQGIYGICTLQATPQEVIEKEISVKKLLDFLDKNSEDEIIINKNKAAQIIEEYDQVSNLFAPYQRAASSRGKYVDKTLKQLGMEDKIKRYE